MALDENGCSTREVTERTSGAEARFFLVLTARLKSCPSRSFAGRVCRVLRQSQQQVPHWAFGPVRNDKALISGWLYAALKRRSSTGGTCGGALPSTSEARSKATSTSKATGRSVRSTRARSGAEARFVSDPSGTLRLRSGQAQELKSCPSRSLAGGVCGVLRQINSRFLTGPSALFGMTRLVRALRGAEAPLFHGWRSGSVAEAAPFQIES